MVCYCPVVFLFLGHRGAHRSFLVTSFSSSAAINIVWLNGFLGGLLGCCYLLCCAVTLYLLVAALRPTGENVGFTL